MKLWVDPIDCEVREEANTVFEAPDREKPPEAGKYTHIAKYSHGASGWFWEFAVVDFPIAGVTMGKMLFIGGPDADPLSRLDRAGSIQVFTVDGDWVCVIQAMRHPPQKNRATLHKVSMGELDMLTGRSFDEFMAGFGPVTIGRYADLRPDVSPKWSNFLSLRTPVGNVNAIFAMIAVTRPVALIKHLS